LATVATISLKRQFFCKIIITDYYDFMKKLLAQIYTYLDTWNFFVVHQTFCQLSFVVVFIMLSCKNNNGFE